jgi:hypothetical protein
MATVQRPLTLIASVLLVVACSKTPETPSGPPVATSMDADVATFLKAIDADRVRVMRDLSQAEYAFHRRLMAVSGMDEELGGTAAADAALRAFRLRALEVWTTDVDARLRPVANSEYVEGTTGIAAASLEIAGFFREVKDYYGTGADKVGVEKSEHGKTSTSVSGGSVAYESTTEINSTGISGSFMTHAKVNVCPNAQGDVKVEFDQETRLNSGGRGVNVKAHIRMTRTVTDDAVYGHHDFETRIESAAFGPKAGSFIDFTLRTSDRPGGVNEGVVNRHSSQVTESDVNVGTTISKMVELLATLITVKAREAWEGGACVKLEPTSDPAKRTGVEPSTSFNIQAAPRSRIDGSPTGGTVRAVLTGGSSLDPANTPVRADASFTYIAPDEKDKEASVAFEARSKRGIGKATVAFDTRAPKAYSVEGGADEFHGTGVACDLGAQFQVQGSGVTVTFVPSSSQGGTYNYTGNMSGFPVWGNGTYTVNYQDEVAVSMTATGPGSVKTPLGTHTRSGSETYTLTPHTGNCSP